MPRARRLLLWFIAVCGISPVLAATALALLKGLRVIRAGHAPGNETIAVGIFGMVELLVIALAVALPAAFVCEFAVNRLKRHGVLRFLFVGATATVLFSAFYAVVWGSISWHLAAAWAFAFVTWPRFALPSLRAAAA